MQGAGIALPPAREWGLCLLVALASAGEAGAQSHFQFRPSLELSGGWDDNLLWTPEPTEEDWTGRATPGLELSLAGNRGSAGVRYGAEAEGFADHPDLAAAPAAQSAEAWFDLKGSRWSGGSRIVYDETQRPWELNVATGLAPGRIEGRRAEGRPSVQYRVSPRSNLKAEYVYGLEELKDGPRGERHVGRGGFEFRQSEHNVISLFYALRRFSFGPGNDEFALTTHVVTMGWERRLGSRTLFKLEAGPRFDGERVGPEVETSLRHTYGRGELGIGYSQTQTTILGELGVAVTDAVVASFSHRLVPKLAFSFAPGWYWTRLEDRDGRVWRAESELAWQIAPYLLLAGGHGFTRETGDLGRSDGAEIRSHRFMLKLRLVPAAAHWRPSDANGVPND